ncbi:MAG: ATP-binding protein [Oscillospiraceae bacterium]|nr:ATP-binding protein [Oscillospiraceae bacterium]
MAISKEYLIQARNELEQLRSENRRNEFQRRAEVLEKIPEYGNLEIKLAESMSKVIALVAAKSPDTAEKLAAVSEENLAVQRKMEQLLTENGYDKNYLDQIYTCKKCADTGVVDGEWCECLKKRAHKLAADELNKRSPLKLCSFENFELSLYSDVQKNGTSPREEMKNNFRICVDFAENFKGNEKGLLMTGGTGLGKTHLSLSIAKKVIEKDFCVVYCSSPELLRTIDNEQFGRSEGDTMSIVTSCDLLVLDDLGAENSSERNSSLLYEIINGRLCRSLPMIINTNLSAGELNARYNERLFSRLFSMEVLFFNGNDNRLK